MVSAAMRDVLEELGRHGSSDVGHLQPTIAETRATFAPGGRLHPLPDDVVVTTVSAGGVAAYWLDSPDVDADRGLLFLHGGGYELGSLHSDGELAARLGRAARMRVLFLEYRLAPEDPFPAALEDALAAWHWLRAEGWSARGMALAGDSAGGGLAVALLVALRDLHEPLPAAAVLMSPTVDLTGSGASMTDRIDQDPISSPALLSRLASDYLAGADPRTPLASPLYAPLVGLPPLLIQAGTADLLLSDAERLAAAAAAAGVVVRLEVADGLPHVYQLMLGTPEAADATARIGSFLRGCVRGDGPSVPQRRIAIGSRTP
jgi:monoterpene epsilon-lactone hydrolase